MSYCFNGDDIAIGPSFAILSQGSRRVQLDRLDAAQIATLKRMRPGQRLGEVEPSFAELLEHHGLLTRSLPNHKRRWHHDLFPLRLPSRVVLTMASPLTVLTYPATLSLMILLSAAVLETGVLSRIAVEDFGRWFGSVSLPGFLITFATLFVCAVVHELGHASSSLRLTGTAGSIRIATYRGIPVMVADVSSVGRVRAPSRALIALSGSVFQIGFSTALLAIPIAEIRLGASMSLLSAGFNLVPLPKADGYWFLRDLFDLRLKPRLWPSRQGAHWTDFCYGIFLLLATIGFAMMVGLECFRALAVGWRLLPLKAVHGAVLIGFGIYMGIISPVFVVVNFRLFRAESTASAIPHCEGPACA